MSCFRVTFIFEKQGKLDDAEQMYNESLQIEPKVFGKCSLDVAGTRENLADGSCLSWRIPKAWLQTSPDLAVPTIYLEATLLLTTARLCLEHQCCSYLGWVLPGVRV